MINTSFRKLSAKKLTMLLLVTFVITCLLVAGCTQENQSIEPEEPTKSEDINVKTVEAVLEQEFTGPDKEYTRLWEKEGQEKFEEMHSYLMNKYEPYFTKNGLDNFVIIAHHYHFSDADYQMSVEEMEVKQSDNKNASNQYDFTVQVAIETPNEEKTLYEMTGKAIFSEEGKIGKMLLGERSPLLGNKLNELMNLE
ncbi:hypothetical protein MHH33_05190 [Paenisporosarcina sp. FSL H8-0542]|uniref:hypothetical protein n=1 Tax=Paenisporosarcina sp. FSL H8-0542 TaxID=2921401 RepID=UPI00315A38E0